MLGGALGSVVRYAIGVALVTRYDQHFSVGDFSGQCDRFVSDWICGNNDSGRRKSFAAAALHIRSARWIYNVLRVGMGSLFATAGDGDCVYSG